MNNVHLHMKKKVYNESGADDMEHEHRRRVIRNPHVRKAEILHGAMELFTRYGYDATSMRDIARELNISLGLCYRYFENKEQLFEEAMDQYVQDCLKQFLILFNNDELDLMEKLTLHFQQMEKEDDIMPYHEFFHQPRNRRLHEALGLRICEASLPYIRRELQHYETLHHCRFDDLDVLAGFITYAQIGLFAEKASHQPSLQAMKRYIMTLLEHACIPEQN